MAGLEDAILRPVRPVQFSASNKILFDLWLETRVFRATMSCPATRKVLSEMEWRAQAAERVRLAMDILGMTHGQR